MTALALRDEQSYWDEAQLAVLEQSGISQSVTRAELSTFLHVCQRTGLDPFARQIYLIGRWDKKAGRDVYRPQTGIDGYRIIAQRTCERTGQSLGYDDTVWCGADGQWTDAWLSPDPPAAAKVSVLRGGQRFSAVALWSEYVPMNSKGEITGLWVKRHAAQLEKCFSSDTEVLTDCGFRLFSQVGDARILQVTDHGLEAVAAVPFVQEYGGPMVAIDGDMLNFSVTPNHDMVTTFGRAEARAIFATATSNYGSRAWRIPLTAPGRPTEHAIPDDDLRLAGFIAADGWHNGYRLFNVSVSRSYKVAELTKLDPETVRIQHSSGSVAATATRQIRSNFDKTVFTFPVERVRGLLGTSKQFAVEELLKLSQRQARILLDAWQLFDGSANRTTGVRRIYTSNPDHVGVVEVLAMLAGYTISTPTKRESDISSREGFYFTISEPAPQPLIRAGAARGSRGMHLEENQDGQVWCVTVPSGQIVVRRNGFAMICGNCAEALALRKAFPNDMAGVYTAEEMAQADNVPPVPAPESQAPVTGQVIPAAANGNGRTERPAQPARPSRDEVDEDAQPFAEEVSQCTTLAALQDVNTRAREARKTSALIRNPATGGTGGLGQYVQWKRRQLEDTEKALRALTEAASAAGVLDDIDEHMQRLTGVGVEAATAAQMRDAAVALAKASVPA